MLLPILNKSIFLTMVLLSKSDELANYLNIRREDHIKKDNKS